MIVMELMSNINERRLCSRYEYHDWYVNPECELDREYGLRNKNWYPSLFECD